MNVALLRAAHTYMQRLRGTAQLSQAGTHVHTRGRTVRSQPEAVEIELGYITPHLTSMLRG